jgi:uncharacterized protein YndB with AHSA1/START domain
MMTEEEAMSAHDVQSARVFPATPAALFATFADPTRLARWWGPAGAVNEFAIFEFHPGGRWHFVMRMPDGAAYQMQQRFLEVTPPERLVIAHDQAGHDFTLTILLAAVDANHSRLQWHMRFASAAEAARVRDVVLASNEENFDRLAVELQRPTAPEQGREAATG